MFCEFIFSTPFSQYPLAQRVSTWIYWFWRIFSEFFRFSYKWWNLSIKIDILNDMFLRHETVCCVQKTKWISIREWSVKVKNDMFYLNRHRQNAEQSHDRKMSFSLAISMVTSGQIWSSATKFPRVHVFFSWFFFFFACIDKLAKLIRHSGAAAKNPHIKKTFNCSYSKCKKRKFVAKFFYSTIWAKKHFRRCMYVLHCCMHSWCLCVRGRNKRRTTK